MGTKINTKKAAEVYDITIEDVYASKLIPNLAAHQLQFIGKNWFKDNTTGTAYHFTKDEAGMLSVSETRQSKASTKNALKAPPKPPTPKIEKPKTAEVVCIDCHKIRIVKVQDVFQVKRCIPCQTIYSNKQRAERSKARKTTPSP